jgi:isoquinoline 1-oxidoreductase subunit alpha
MATSFILNGKPKSVDVDPEMPLLWVLRDTLNLTGTKFGCGMALCGACTVHIDGEATRSCITSISSVAGKKVTTIEGISPDRSHPVQQAWIELDVPQCGYCQSGQIMSACALLAKKAKPTDGQIDDAMAGNICRCGTYQRIRKAIHRAAELHASPPHKPASLPIGGPAAPETTAQLIKSLEVPAEFVVGGAE